MEIFCTLYHIFCDKVTFFMLPNLLMVNLGNYFIIIVIKIERELVMICSSIFETRLKEL